MWHGSTVAVVFITAALGFTPLGGADDARAADVAYGEYLAGECATCHRTEGETKGIPAIVGWPSDAFVAALAAYRDRSRQNLIMQTIAGRLGDAEMAALAAYYERLPRSK